MKSNILDQFGDAHLEGAANSPQRGQRNVLFAPLDPAHVIRVKVGLFGQFLLAQTSTFPFFTDGCAKNDPVIRTRAHAYKQPQTHQTLYTAKRMIFYCIRGNLSDNGDQSMKPGTKKEHLEAMRRPSFIVPGTAISTQQLPTNVLPRAGLKPQIEETGTNGIFGIWKSGFMSVFKIGRRYGLFGCRQAAELTSLPKHVRHAAPRQLFAGTTLPNLQVGRFYQGKLPKLAQELYQARAVSGARQFTKCWILREDFSRIVVRRVVATLAAGVGYAYMAVAKAMHLATMYSMKPTSSAESVGKKFSSAPCRNHSP